MAGATIILTFIGSLLLCVTSVPVKKSRDVDIYSFHINSTVNSRYAVTTITSRVANRLNESKEVHFQVKIPKNAFITKFRMIIEGKTYDGVVKQKEAAQQQYSQAVSRGESAGIVSSVGRTLEEFKTSVTVAALSKVTFHFTYEELLKRRLGKYKLQINAQPMQPVADFKVDVYITERSGISFLEVNGGLKTQEMSSAVITTLSASTKEAWVNFYPTREQQTNCEGCGENGLNGDLFIEYDVKRPNQNGELQALNSYFVHYFAPTDVQKIPKNVVFLIDQSGSMQGTKIHQTRLAMLKILGDLAEDDYFGLITFDSIVHVWNPELLQAKEENLEKAKSFVKAIQARGGTNINQVVLNGVEMIKSHPRQGSASIVILLTDGDPTSGETNTERIQANVKKAIDGKFPLYCLGFGFDVNFDFLEKMAQENDGVARRIYEDSDADLQLQGFYEEVATPLLTDVQLKYPGAANLTQTSFRQYYNGSEIVVAGQITDNSLETLQTEVIAISKNTNVTYQDSTSAKDLIDVLPQHENFIQRLWAHLTVKQLLEKEVALTGQEKEAAKKKALDLSLKYEFVTPLTSMVVTKPQEEETQVAHKPKEGAETPTTNHRVMQYSPPLPRGPIPLPPQGIPDQRRPPLLHSFSGQGLPGQSGHPNRHRRPSLRIHSGQGLPKQTGQTEYILSRLLHDYDSPVLAVDRSPLLPEHPMPTITSQNKPPPTTTPAVSVVRFLLSAQPKQICYDTPVGHKLRLFLDGSSDISINGQLSEKGFTLVAIHYKTAKLLVSPNESVYSEGENSVKFVWGQPEPSSHESQNMAIFQRTNEIDVTMGTVRVVVLIHKNIGDVFLWPVVHKQGKDSNFRGILGKNDLQYEELQGSKLKINDQEVDATLSSAKDYRFAAAPSVECWLVPFQSALQGELSDFTVSQL
ncbi:inter-alpha-trypsin inhibitor heavy chain H3-like isoform X2 [Tachysurus vachellii]|uniref:inter-alpha-trypsin inhibitor heavy chain H3-like isoform X2 n=1 Tax=Tachysurus vachellii TaxID=175792 RepID=UPI00296A9104|nr:inter-alpha-trypsin inhibitor heavy chain H3-like isoform X2 [Tachysurus vachellii]